MGTHSLQIDRSLLGKWVVACTLAEAVGMSAASGAAKLTQSIDVAAVALALVVVGGLVEGLALGLAQGTVLVRRWPGVVRRRYVAVTLVVAGLGWAAGAAPGVLAGDDSGTEPPLLLMLAGAAGIGLAMGPLLGAAQATVLRGAVPHPWRWVSANTAAWPPAMVVIFFGATRPGEDWSVPAVLGLGALTGVVAGSVLGLVSGAWLPSLDGTSMPNRLVLACVRRRWFGADRALIGLTVRGRRSGRAFTFPVQYAEDTDGLVVVPGHAGRKVWWRNLRTPDEVEVVLAGERRAAVARVLLPGEAGHAEALATYQARWPRAELPDDQLAVRIGLAQHHSRTPRRLKARSRSTTGSRSP